MKTHIHFLCSPVVLLIYVLFTNYVLLVQSVSVHLPSLQRKDISARQDGTSPEFPQSPASCPLCEENYANINSCAAAAPVFANFSMVRQAPISGSFLFTDSSQIIFNPGAFISVIECACTDTFQSAYPQCVDW